MKYLKLNNRDGYKCLVHIDTIAEIMQMDNDIIFFSKDADSLNYELNFDDPETCGVYFDALGDALNK